MALSRAKVAAAALLLFGLLDAGRSWIAWRAYRKPHERWGPTPDVAEELAWPPGSGTRADAPLGERLYRSRCAVCHGPAGRGNGPAAPSLRTPPRDFTQGEFKFKSTAQGEPPTREDLVRIVRDGLPASPMPYFSDVLKPEEISAVVAYVEKLAGIDGTDPTPLAIPSSPGDRASVARGEVLYGEMRCASCHGDDGHERRVFPCEGSPTPAAEEPPLAGHATFAPDLGQPWTFHGGSDAAHVWVRLTAGIVPGPMPSYAAAATPRERWDLSNYVVSLAWPAPWAPGGRLRGLGVTPDLLRRGEYLSRVEICQRCHTPIGATGIYRDDRRFAGGMAMRAYPHGDFVSRNLTSDPRTGLARLSESEIARILRDGRRGSEVLSTWGMPWMVFHAFSEEDAHGLARWLKKLPPLSHPVPESVRYGVIESALAKSFFGLPAAIPPRLVYLDGDFSGVANARPIERRLAGCEIAVLVLFTLAFLFGGRRPRAFGGWARRTLALAGLAMLAFAVDLVAWLPSPPLIPPATIANPLLSAVPKIDPTRMTPWDSALAARGRHLWETASCVYCHGADGRGGAKLSWKVSGTIYVPNVTPDRETGLGRWSDAQIARAIRSGMARDGRPLHWQAMPWDLFANLEEEDVRALIAWLRRLPPVNHAIPPPRPPAPDDCRDYTFFSASDLPPGCRG